MRISSGVLLKGALWTIGTYGLVTALRLVTNVALARLLAPELFGLMLIVYTLRTGIELISDLGIGQNIIYNKDANDPEFYNTAWSLQLIRSIVLWILFIAAAAPIANFYNSQILLFVIPLTSFSIVLGGLTSIGRPLLQKRLQLQRLSSFELLAAVFNFAISVLFAYLTPTIWALVFGGLLSTLFTTVGSYFLLSDVKQRFHLSQKYLREILSFGKWIFVSSIVFFLSTNFDRLYLAKVIPLSIFGIYGIARSISELLGGLVSRLGNYVLFPFIASHFETARADLRQQLAPLRAKFLLAAAFGFSLFVATSDLAIKLLYDERYREASWILPVLVSGSWFTILANFNESTLLGLGKPSYSAVSNGVKFAALLIGLPAAVAIFGLLGGVAVVTFVDLARYLPILIGQFRERFAFGRQDLIMTLVTILLVGVWEWARWAAGLGTSFDSFPVAQFLDAVR